MKINTLYVRLNLFSKLFFHSETVDWDGGYNPHQKPLRVYRHIVAVLVHF